MTAASRTIALFDFDGTLIHGDSLFPFFGYLAGWPSTVATMTEGLWHGYTSKWKAADKAAHSTRTVVKTYLLEQLLSGVEADALPPVLEKLRGWVKWKDDIRAKLLDHRRQGHHVVIASGGLDVYLPHLLKDTPHDALICTTIGRNGGQFTGQMTSGNCVRQRKAELVREYLATHGPFADSWGYGNAPHDLPMLELVKHRIVV